MGETEQTVTIHLRTVSEFGDVSQNVKQLQSYFDKLKLPPEIKTQLINSLKQGEQAAGKVGEALGKGIRTKGDLKTLSKGMDGTVSSLEHLQKVASSIPKDVLEKAFEIDDSKLVEAKKQLTELQNQLKAKIDASGFKDVEQAAQNLSKYSDAKSIQNFVKSFEAGDIKGCEQALRGVELGLRSVEKGSDPTKIQAYQTAVQTFREKLEGLSNASGELGSVQSQISMLETAISDHTSEELQKQLQAFEQLTGVDLQKLISEVKGVQQNLEGSGKAAVQANTELDQLKNKIQMFFGLNNAVNLFKRALRATFETVKDLDKVMTETAVVTDFSVGDMWSQLPEYTKRANELGVSIHDVYEASTLYYQQGRVEI